MIAVKVTVTFVSGCKRRAEAHRRWVLNGFEPFQCFLNTRHQLPGAKSHTFGGRSDLPSTGVVTLVAIYAASRGRFTGSTVVVLGRRRVRSARGPGLSDSTSTKVRRTTTRCSCVGHLLKGSRAVARSGRNRGSTSSCKIGAVEPPFARRYAVFPSRKQALEPFTRCSRVVHEAGRLGISSRRAMKRSLTCCQPLLRTTHW